MNSKCYKYVSTILTCSGRPLRSCGGSRSGAGSAECRLASPGFVPTALGSKCLSYEPGDKTRIQNPFKQMAIRVTTAVVDGKE